MDPARIRADIVEVGRRLYARGLIAANEGNVSVRDGDVVFITPAGVCKGYLTPEMIVETDLAGRPRGTGRASTETLMHTAVYRRRSDVQAVVHAHPPAATGFAVAGVPLDRPVIAEAVVTLGAVPVIPYGMPSTTELADNVGAAICDAHALLMANHGALAVGENVYRAWERMEALEQLARVSLVTRVLGGDKLLPAGDVERLLASRAASGYPPPACDAAPPAAGPARTVVPARGAGDGEQVVLTRDELVRLLTEAVERFGTR